MESTAVAVSAPPAQEKVKQRMWVFKNLFVPNAYNPEKIEWAVAAFWIFFIVTLWSSYPGVTIIPKPLEIVKAWIDVWNNDALFWELMESAWLFGISTVVTLVLSLTLAYATTIAFFRPLVLGISKLRYFSLYGLTTIFTMMTFGVMSFKVSLLVFGMATYFLTSMAEVVLTVPENEKEHARSIRLSEWEIVWHVIIVGRRHKAIEILRQNSAMGWMMLSMVEGMAMSQGGVGALLIKQYKMFRLSNVYAVQFTIFCVGMLSDLGFKFMLLWLCEYKRKSKGGLNYAG